ncbi:hypothetical protein [Pseudolabrys taiwanensis]|uniref:hypothetical protein n=1 Tax=Pseudolabrys taiwanensis TaxID=331696 RepID=UPI001AEC7CCD|nr:hypothetical protein [Pseudolabrys taiwanensis]
MSRFLGLIAAVALVGGLFVLNPGPAQAQRHGGYHGGGWHGGGWRGGGYGWRGGYYRRGWGGGWGWGPAIGLGIGVGSGWGWGYPYGYYAPGPSYYYGPPARCGYVRVRVWRSGYWVIRRVWRCW